MTDRELLELAAMAYWGSEIDDVCSIRWLEEDQCIGYTHADNQDHNGNDVELCWNPLLDDGDAFRLAVKLSLLVDCLSHCARPLPDSIEWQEGSGPDACANTRRAIVRAAAELAKQEKP